jgi:serine/threonine protein kinase
MNTQSKCPDSVRWNELLDSGMPEAEASWLNKHLERCADCQSTLEQLTAGEAGWADAAVQIRDLGPRPELRRAMEQLKAAGEAGLETVAPTAVGDATLPFLRTTTTSEQLGRLGVYEVLEEIGRGGMGVVLKAFDPNLQRLTAIKVLGPQWASHDDARLRFVREARAAALIRHENVVAIHAVDNVDGLPYLVMEYVPGMSLQQRLDNGGPMEIEEILAIGSQAAAGLAAAHDQGLIHRDIKPANILLDSAGNVRLTDFGLARAVDDTSLTQTGVIAGTPQYMAPEQASGARLDHRADLFSLGSVLYAMCTGEPPFRAQTTVAVLKRLCDETPPDVREINPEIPDWFAEIIERLHAKRPRDRFRSADEVARLLSQYLRYLRAPDTVKKPRPLGRPGPWRPWVWWAAGLGVAGAVGVSLLVVSLVLWLRPMPLANVQPPPPRAQDDPFFQKVWADLDNDNKFKRKEALETLAAMKPNDQRGEVAKKLVALTETGDWLIRRPAVLALGAWAGPEEVPALIKTIEHADVFTRQEGLKVIGRFRDPQTVAPVIRCFRDFSTQKEAGNALREIGGMAEPDVLALLKEQDVFLKKAAALVLAAIGSEASVPALQDAVAGGNFHLAPAAQQALTAIAARKKN